VNIEETVTKNQVDSDTKAVRNTIDEIAHLARHQHPIALHAPIGNRVELLQIVREVGRKPVGRNRKIGDLRLLTNPAELCSKVFDDRQAGPSMYLPGETLSLANQDRIVKIWSESESRYCAPSVFLILTGVHPTLLIKQKVWKPEFGELIGARIVRVRSAQEREVDDLVNLYRSAVRRAAQRKSVRINIQQGAIDLLTAKWHAQRPKSLDLVVLGAEKAVEDAQLRLTRIAAEVAAKQPLTITGREVIDAFMPDSEIGAAGQAMRQVIRENMH
jgi:hypothetical protein